MSIKSSKFAEFLLKRSELLDEEIIRSIHPDSTWIGRVETGSLGPPWFDTQEAVRRISEGLAFVPSNRLDGPESTFDRFSNVFPDLSKCWEPVK